MTLAVGLIGLAEMAIQGVVLLSFQAVHGTVYSHVGLIVTAFMAGLAAGSGLAAGRRKIGRGARLIVSPRATMVAIAAALVLYAAGLAVAVRLAPPAWAYLLMALAAGALGGAAFPLAAECLAVAGRDRGRAAGRLYAADLAGACLGALLASTLLVPVLGLPGTCLAAGAVALAGLLAIV